jgi:type 1 glutamine amidotransferase
MNIGALQAIREQSKQSITNAILSGRYSCARDMINDALEYQEMIGGEFIFISDSEVNDFYQAINEEEIRGQ